MTPDDTLPAAPADAVSSTLEAAAPTPATTTEGAIETASPSTLTTTAALTWVDERTVAPTRTAPVETRAAHDLLGRPPRRSVLRPSVIVPTTIAALLAGAYAATTLLWPLHSVAPVVDQVAVQPVTVAAASPAWPATGSAAVSVVGFPGSLASSTDAAEIASITKVVTALVVLEEMPLALGEQGPEYRFTQADRRAYWEYRENGESAVDVPVGSALTQYQMLEAMLVGSGNNYADRLASAIWPSDAVFASAANAWLDAHGVGDVTVFEPTGLDARNTATPASLLALAQRALAHPVIAEIVAKTSVDLPGVGTIRNTNGLLADAGVVGVKTGTLDTWNLLVAKDVTIGEATVRVYASVLGQTSDDERQAAARALFAQIEAELQLQPSVPAGTTVGRVTTRWGDDVAIVTATDAQVVLWNGDAADVTTDLSLGDARAAGAEVGSLTADGPLDDATVSLELAGEVTEPDAWWRLTHPLDLFGLTG